MAASVTSQPNDLDQELVPQSYQKTDKKFNEIVPTLPKGKGWWFEHLVQYKGFWLPIKPGLKGLIFIQDHLKSKYGDIILATSPKCGTTWLRALIFATINRTSYDLAAHPLLSCNPRDLVPFLESYICANERIPGEDDIPSPRIFSTHIPYTLFPDMVKASGGCRFVYICREPKDVLVSKWHFANKVRSKELPPLSLQEAFESFCKGVSHYGPFWDHVLSYWKASLETPEKVLFLKYEDMKREPSVQIKRLAEFLGKPFSPKEESEGMLQEIIRLCSFENLSNLDVNKNTHSRYPVKNPDFFRKGETGDWENHLTLEMAARLDEITKEKLHPFGLTFDSTPVPRKDGNVI